MMNEEETRALWKELHLYALAHTVGTDQASWVLIWSRKIPRYTPKGSCACNEHFNKWYGAVANKPNYKEEGGFFDWSVRLHNSVNTRLNKREWTIEEARIYYTNLSKPKEVDTIVPTETKEIKD